MTLIELLRDQAQCGHTKETLDALNDAADAIEALQADYQTKCSELELVHESRDALQAEERKMVEKTGYLSVEVLVENYLKICADREALQSERDALDSEVGDLRTEKNRILQQLSAWTSVFGHLGTPDQCGNEWAALQAENERLTQRYEDVTSEEHSIPQLRKQLWDSFDEKAKAFDAIGNLQTALANAIKERDALAAKLVPLKAEAERFRWIRLNPVWLGWEHDFRPDEIDKAVDAAKGGQHEDA